MERSYTSRPHPWNERPFSDWNDWHAPPDPFDHYKGRKWVDGIAEGDSHLLYFTWRGLSNLTQRLVHGIVPKAFMGWALILTPMAIFLVTRESLIGESSGSSPICSIICLLGRQLGVRWWASSPCLTQLFLQLINFTLHVSFILCMEDVAFPLWLTLAGMRGMYASFIISHLLRVYNWIVMLKAPRFCLVQINIILM